MKSSEKKLKRTVNEALVNLYQARKGIRATEANNALILFDVALEWLQEALAASERTDMECFAHWLRCDWIMHLPTGDKAVDGTRKALMNDILEHIATEFGVGEDE